jgi:hypothetical protein
MILIFLEGMRLSIQTIGDYVFIGAVMQMRRNLGTWVGLTEEFYHY